MAGEKMSKSLGNTLQVREMVHRYRPVELRYYLGAAHYRSVVAFSESSLDEAAVAYRRIENFVERALQVTEPTSDRLPTEFVAALDDDLGVPAALAAYCTTRYATATPRWRTASSAAIGDRLGEVLAMAAILGVDPRAWADTSASDLSKTVDALVGVALEQRAAARERKDYAAADAIREQLTDAGVVVEDTPAGPRWNLQ